MVDQKLNPVATTTYNESNASDLQNHFEESFEFHNKMIAKQTMNSIL